MDGNFLQGGVVHGVRRIRSTTRVHHQGLPFTTVTAMTEQVMIRVVRRKFGVLQKKGASGDRFLRINPMLLDSIGYLNDKEKDDVRKIMSSKQLFCEEMCSYNNGNRLHLPHDLALQRSWGSEESERGAAMQTQWIESQTLQLEEQKLQIQVELLELEKQRFRWERFSKRRDQELERLRMIGWDWS
ncbi:hypothetical protein DY000_02023771 [Brassica cretica]|uniref:Uncharacterized protein n=1 Tax=Brassica cretica TaxID=69181 RepID=A0ABQ7E318_BRACR|nr:hypothetical protein DY000_02023771 [Brassica cretica]